MLRQWYEQLAVSPLFIDPGSPWENGYVESFNGKLRDELLHGELFYALHEAQVIVKVGANATIRDDRIVRWGIGHPPQRPAPPLRSVCRRD
jgi:transposase InsO family protein